MADVSVIIITWNSEDDIAACIDSVLGSAGGLNIEIIVIDNNSSDKTCEIISGKNDKNLQLIRNNSNLGFTKAVNQGIRLAKGRNILLLNPDTVLKENAVKTLSDFLDVDKEYGACTPLLQNEDGSIQHSIRSFPSYWKMYCEFTLLAYIFPKTKLFGGWKMKYFDYSHDADVNQPMAAVLMVRKSFFDENDLMDERFEMFYNDVDLCKRIIDSGKRIRFLKNAVVTHKKGASIYKDRVKMIKVWNKDCLKYFEKYHMNILLILWLKISLKISEILRILYIKIFK